MVVVRAFRRSEVLKELENLTERFGALCEGAEVVSERIMVCHCGGELDNPMVWGDMETHHELLVCTLCGKKYVLEEPQYG
jgi:uncharacterized Zn-finger protein